MRETWRRVNRLRHYLDELLLCHDLDYIGQIRAVSESGRTVMLDEDTVCTPSTFETARLAAGTRMLRDIWWTAWETSKERQ